MQYYKTVLRGRSVSGNVILTELSYFTSVSMSLHRSINSNPFNQMPFDLIVSLKTNLT